VQLLENAGAVSSTLRVPLNESTHPLLYLLLLLNPTHFPHSGDRIQTTISTKIIVPRSSKGKPVPQLAAPTQNRVAVLSGSVQITHPVELDDEVDENAGGDDHAWSEALPGISCFTITVLRMLTVIHSMELHHHNCIQCYWIPLPRPTLSSPLPSRIASREMALRKSEELPRFS